MPKVVPHRQFSFPHIKPGMTFRTTGAAMGRESSGSPWSRSGLIICLRFQEGEKFFGKVLQQSVS